MIKELSATESGRDRLVLWSENVDKAIAERVEFDDKKSRPQPQTSLPAEQGEATTKPDHINDEAPRSTPYVEQPSSAHENDERESELAKSEYTLTWSHAPEYGPEGP